MLIKKNGVSASVRRLALDTLLSIGIRPSYGLEILTDSALRPITNPLLQLRVMLDIDHLEVNLPPLIEATAIDMAIGIHDTYNIISTSLGGEFGHGLRIIGGDSDIHPGYRFSSAIENDEGRRIAVKFRNPSAELFLSRVLSRLKVNRSIYVPSISTICDNMHAQEYVAQSQSVRARPDEFWHDAGRFLAICDIVGLNDMHHFNVLRESDRFAVIDAETIFQDAQKSALPQHCVLRSHCLFPYGYEGKPSEFIIPDGYAKGFLAIALSECGGASRSALDPINLILDGFRSWPEMLGAIVEEIGDGMLIRSVRLPTAVYGDLISSAAAKHYHSSREVFKSALAGRLNSIWGDQSDLNESDAEALSNCQIPFNQRHITPLEAENYVKFSASRIKSTLQERIEGLAWAVRQATGSHKTYSPK